MILRTQADRNRPGDVLAVAAAFRQAVGSGWAAVAWGEGQVDILLAGPTELVPAPAARRGVAVVDLRALADRWPQVGPLRMTHPRGVFAPAPTARAFGLWLRSKHK